MTGKDHSELHSDERLDENAAVDDKPIDPWALLLTEQSGPLLHEALLRGLDFLSAQDAVQEVLLLAWKDREQLDHTKGNVLAWLRMGLFRRINRERKDVPTPVKPPPLSRCQAAYEVELPELLLHHRGKWVAYADGQRLPPIKDTQAELYRYCLEESGLTHDRFIVRRIVPLRDPIVEYNHPLPTEVNLEGSAVQDEPKNPQTPLSRCQAAYEAELPELLLHHRGKWVAYADGQRLPPIKDTQAELYRYCLEESGLTHDRFIVRRIVPLRDPRVEYNRS